MYTFALVCMTQASIWLACRFFRLDFSTGLLALAYPWVFLVLPGMALARRLFKETTADPATWVLCAFPLGLFTALLSYLLFAATHNTMALFANALCLAFFPRAELQAGCAAFLRSCAALSRKNAAKAAVLVCMALLFCGYCLAAYSLPGQCDVPYDIHPGGAASFAFLLTRKFPLVLNDSFVENIYMGYHSLPQILIVQLYKFLNVPAYVATIKYAYVAFCPLLVVFLTLVLTRLFSFGWLCVYGVSLLLFSGGFTDALFENCLYFSQLVGILYCVVLLHILLLTGSGPPLKATLLAVTLFLVPGVRIYLTLFVLFFALSRVLRHLALERKPLRGLFTPANALYCAALVSGFYLFWKYKVTPFIAPDNFRAETIAYALGGYCQFLFTPRIDSLLLSLGMGGMVRGMVGTMLNLFNLPVFLFFKLGVFLPLFFVMQLARHTASYGEEKRLLLLGFAPPFAYMLFTNIIGAGEMFIISYCLLALQLYLLVSCKTLLAHGAPLVEFRAADGRLMRKVAVYGLAAVVCLGLPFYKTLHGVFISPYNVAAIKTLLCASALGENAIGNLELAQSPDEGFDPARPVISRRLYQALSYIRERTPENTVVVSPELVLRKDRSTTELSVGADYFLTALTERVAYYENMYIWKNIPAAYLAKIRQLERLADTAAIAPELADAAHTFLVGADLYDRIARQREVNVLYRNPGWVVFTAAH